MATPNVTPEKKAEVRRLLAQGLPAREVADRSGLSLGSISNIRNEKPGAAKSAGTDDASTVEVIVSRPIKTLADAVRECEVDTAVWFVDKWECGAWTTGMKFGVRGEEQAVQQQQYRVKLFLRRIQPKALQAATDAIFERMAKHAPKYQRPTHKKAAAEDCLAVFGLFDAHFGKLCWGPETGDNYDLAIAESVYANAVDDLIADAANRPVGRVVLPIGNDFFHIDNSRNTTFNNTPQDVDGRYAKVIESGEMAVIKAVERLAEIAPVQVVWVPGNHDPTTSFHLARTVKAWFRNHSAVEVDAGPSPRKYVSWGVNLLGLTHGNEEKIDALAGLMAAEQKAAWATTECREWLIGHMHRSRAWTTKPLETQDAITVRVLRSLAGTDAWHHRKAFLNLSRAGEVYFYGREKGYLGHAIAPARLDSPTIKGKRKSA